MIYRGIICKKPLARHTYEGEWTAGVHTQEQREELTEDEVQQMWPSLAELPLRYVHEQQKLDLGRVISPFRTPEGDVGVEIEFNNTISARMLEPQVMVGLLRGLSLSHDRLAMRPLEVSLTEYGARPGTWLEQRAFTNDKSSSYVLPPRIDIMSASTTPPRDPETGKFTAPAPAADAAAPAPAAAAPAAPAPAAAAPTPMDTSGTTAGGDPIIDIARNKSLSDDERERLVAFALKRTEEEVELRKKLAEAEAQLKAKDADELTSLKTYASNLQRVLTLTGVSNDDSLRSANEALARGETGRFLQHMTSPIVACAAAVERLVGQREAEAANRKRSAESEERLNSLVAAYERMRGVKLTPSAPAPAPQKDLVQMSAPLARAPAPAPAAPEDGFAKHMEARLSAYSRIHDLNVNMAHVTKRAKLLEH